MAKITKDYRSIVKKYLDELPNQIGLLKDHYKKIFTDKTLSKKMVTLSEYESRMRDGLLFLDGLTDRKTISLIELIRKHPQSLLRRNRVRYLKSLFEYRAKIGKRITKGELGKMIDALRAISLFHTTKNPKEVRATGLLPASDLWLTEHKSCANPMDLVLGLDKPVFFTHGFHLSNFSDEFVHLDNRLIDLPSTLVSSLDLFTFVLVKTKKVAPCAIETKEWIVALEDYSRNLFLGSDFWRLKAEYILTFFDSIDEYDRFAIRHYYANTIEMAPKGEAPFLGEIKIFKKIPAKQLIN